VKWSGRKFNVFKANERVVKCSWVKFKMRGSEVSTSVVKCSDLRLNGAVGNLNVFKANERVVKCSWVKFKMRGSEVSTSALTWSEV
jgi:hypothetical protein